MSGTPTPEDLDRIARLAAQLSRELEQVFGRGRLSGRDETATRVLTACEDAGLLEELERLAALQRGIDAARAQHRRGLEAPPGPRTCRGWLGRAASTPVSGRVRPAPARPPATAATASPCGAPP